MVDIFGFFLSVFLSIFWLIPKSGGLDKARLA